MNYRKKATLYGVCVVLTTTLFLNHAKASDSWFDLIRTEIKTTKQQAKHNLDVYQKLVDDFRNSMIQEDIDDKERKALIGALLINAQARLDAQKEFIGNTIYNQFNDYLMSIGKDIGREDYESVETRLTHVEYLIRAGRMIFE